MRIKRFASILLAMSLGTVLNAQIEDYVYWDRLEQGETISQLKDHVQYLSSASLKGRGMGTDGEAEAAAYIHDVFREYGLDTMYSSNGDVFGLLQESGDTLVSRNSGAFISGYDSQLKNHYIVIGARMDNIGEGRMTVNGESRDVIYPGANGNASGIAMMLELASKLKTNELLLRRSVIFVGFGSSMNSFAGAWYFLNRSFSGTASIDAMINLDSLGEGDFMAYTSSNDDLEYIINRANAELQPITPVISRQEPFPSDHQAFYASEIPSVMFTTGLYKERGSVRDVPSNLDYSQMERELEYLYNFSVKLINTDHTLNFRSDGLSAEKSSMEGAVPYYDCDRRPVFLGSDDPRVFLSKWVYQYLRYPQEAVANGIQGKVLVDFVIDEKGKVCSVNVAKGVHPLLDAEAVRVIEASPDWRPGRKNGKKVKAMMSLYVEFRLERKK